VRPRGSRPCPRDADILAAPATHTGRRAIRTSQRCTLVAFLVLLGGLVATPARAFNPDPFAAAVILTEAWVTGKAALSRAPDATLPRRLQVAAGWFDVAQRRNVAAMGTAQYFPGGHPFLQGAPYGGVMVTTDGSRFGFGGLQYRLHLGRHWDATSGFGVGAYGRGAGKQLGSWLEATFCLALSRRLPDGMRLRLEARHISHDDVITHYDPGSDILAVGLSIPLQ